MEKPPYRQQLFAAFLYCNVSLPDYKKSAGSAVLSRYTGFTRNKKSLYAAGNLFQRRNKQVDFLSGRIQREAGPDRPVRKP